MNPLPKLKDLIPTDKIRLAAELDGWKPHEWYKDTIMVMYHKNGALLHEAHIDSPRLRSYSTSYDAIIPLIQKQPDDVHRKFVDYLIYNESLPNRVYSESPSQLLDALLVATGKAEL